MTKSDKKMDKITPPELSRPLKVERVPMGGICETIVATPAEREALIKRFGLVELTRFEARLDVDRAEGEMFAVTGELSADAVQSCVVSLEPVAETVSEAIDVLFAPAHLIKENHEGGLGDLGEAEPPEPIIGGYIDLGELVAQHFAMALNPYPRKEGAELGEIEVTAKKDPAVTSLNPFAKLKG